VKQLQRAVMEQDGQPIRKPQSYLVDDVVVIAVHRETQSVSH